MQSKQVTYIINNLFKANNTRRLVDSLFDSDFV